jgi:hypothetical protein
MMDHDEWYDWEPAPIDSYDLYAMGLRAPRCNGCEYAKLKWELGDKFLALKDEHGWTNVYELDREPGKGQGEPYEHEGRPVYCRVGFMSIQHSDECYHWQPPPPRPQPQPSKLDRALAAIDRILEELLP